VLAVDGRARVSQRYAIDWVRPENGSTFRGKREDNSAYHAYGAEVIAVADGTIVAVKDGIPENVPGLTSRAVPITLETIGGNLVVHDIGQGQYAFYAHLQPGSLRVKPGDRVQRGQVLGLLGNSGNSTEPHLHFHIGNGPAILGSEGVPFVIREYELIGARRDLGYTRATFSARSPAPMFQNPPPAQIESLLRSAHTIAVVGLSANPARPSYSVARALQRYGYRIIPVNPHVDAVLGERAVPDLDHARSVLRGGERLDIVDVFRRPEHVAAIVEDCIRLQFPALWLQEGVVDEAAAERARAAGIFTVMDRCIYKARAALPPPPE